MNTVLPMYDGSVVTLTRAEAVKLIGYLLTRLPHVDECDQPATLRLIAHLGAIVDPMRQYDPELWGSA